MQKIYKITITITGFILLLAVILVLLTKFPVRGSLYQGQITNLEFGWYDSKGLEIDLMHIDFDENHQAMISIPIDSHEVNNRSLCFTSRNINFSIYLSNKLIYDFQPELSGFYGKYYGDYLHAVPIPSFYGSTELHIKCTALLENGWTGFDNMILQDSGIHILSKFRESMPNFLVCFITFGIGIVLFIGSLLFQEIQHHPIESISLGAVTMVLSMWASSQNQVIILLTGNSGAVHVLDYLALMVMPIPVLIFISSITQNLNHKLVKILILLSCLNILLQFTMVLMGISDYHNMLVFSHGIIIFGICLIIYLIISSKKKNQINQSQQIYLVTGLITAIIGGILDMIRYYFFYAKDSSALSRIGLLIFVIILSFYQFQHMLAIRLKSSEAEMMHTLATEDALTGLKNRTAFNEFEQELLRRTKGYCLFIHLDVNHLKKVNDTYGHADGDKHIKAAASVIQNSFGEKGYCFRVGGDEFFAILDSESCYFDYEIASEKFYQLIQEYNQTENPPVPLAIAHGIAEYHYSTKNPDEAEKLADSRMYENKRQMKSTVLSKKST
ncbi:MAG: GGDEF domain-containing protein [Oscillospiraceae bacterium]|nr:GGDEF domain-containing protein [Oscillospiraceae bacterium]